MTNAASSKTHGCIAFNQARPKSKLFKRRNKIKASIRKQERRAVLGIMG